MMKKAVSAACWFWVISSGLFFIFSCSHEDPDQDAPENPADTTTPVISYVYHVPEQTHDGWETASLDAVNMDTSGMKNLVEDILRGQFPEVHSVLVIKDGKLVFEEYFPGHDFNYFNEGFLGDYVNFDRNTLHNTHSLTKSIISALAGIAIDKGYIKGINDPVFNYLPAYQQLKDSVKERITIRHLLTMSSGLAWNEWTVPAGDPDYDIYKLDIALDPIFYVLSKNMAEEPGSTFNYNGGTVDLLGEIIGESSGIRLDSFCNADLFKPLGIGNAQFQHLTSGLIVAHGDIYMRPRDMAKFGFLYLNHGNWNGKQIVSQHWIEESVKAQIAIPHLSWAKGYGYLWWRNDYYHNGQYYTAYKAMGWGGQEIFVFPNFSMVVVFTGASYTTDPPCDRIVSSYILPAIN